VKQATLALAALCASVVVAGTAAQAGPFGNPYSGPHACALLTAPLAQSVAGKDARQTRSTTPSKFETLCQFTSRTGFVTLKAGTWGWLKPHPGQGTRVAGLGDEAWISPMGLVVRKGDRAINLLVAITGSYTGPAADTVQARQYALEKGLAPKLLSAL
jgi:hypothetical protein